MKKIALVSTFCDTEEKQNILKETIEGIKNLGIDIMVNAPISIPIKQEIIDLCDFFFYTKENPLLKWPVRHFNHWYKMPIENNKVCVLEKGLSDYSWARLYQSKKLSQFALSFDYDQFYHIEYDVEIDEVVKNAFLSDEVNIIFPRRDPHDPTFLRETTLHLMVFDRPMMENIEKEIKQIKENIKINKNYE